MRLLANGIQRLYQPTRSSRITSSFCLFSLPRHRLFSTATTTKTFNMSLIPTDSDLQSLSSLVSNQYDAAISSGDAFFYPSDKVTVLSSTGVEWQVRTVTALSQKPIANKDDTTQEQSKQKQNKTDVFSPPYVTNLLIKELGDHILLLNKFCVVPQHFLMVTRAFESQDLPPSPTSLALAYRIITCWRPSSSSFSSSELLGFYNCGQQSGASQPHRHFQFIQCPSPLSSTSEIGHPIPIESLLDRIESDGKEHDHVHALPVPWQHFVVLLSPSKSDPIQLEMYMANRFTCLLDAMFRARLVGTTTTDTLDSKLNRPSFNLLITKRALHMIPRQKESFDWVSETNLDPLSINSLGYAGFMLTRSEKELETLTTLENGVEKVLSYVGSKPVQDVTMASGLPTTNM